MLAENEASTAQDVVEDQTDQTEVQNDTQDKKISQDAIYAKKQRQRAQKAEEKIKEYEQKLQDLETAQLEEQGKYKEMYTKLKKESDVWKKNSKEYEEYQNSEKSLLLEQLPEEDREVFSDLKLPQLKKLVNKVSVKPTAPKVVHGNVDSKKEGGKTFAEMTEKERKANWGGMVNTYFENHTENMKNKK